MKQILKFLQGKKTIILSILFLLVTALTNQGILNEIRSTFAYSVLSLLGVGTSIATNLSLPKKA